MPLAGGRGHSSPSAGRLGAVFSPPRHPHAGAWAALPGAGRGKLGLSQGDPTESQATAAWPPRSRDAEDTPRALRTVAPSRSPRETWALPPAHTRAGHQSWRGTGRCWRPSQGTGRPAEQPGDSCDPGRPRSPARDSGRWERRSGAPRERRTGSAGASWGHTLGTHIWVGVAAETRGAAHGGVTLSPQAAVPPPSRRLLREALLWGRSQGPPRGPRPLPTPRSRRTQTPARPRGTGTTDRRVFPRRTRLGLRLPSPGAVGQGLAPRRGNLTLGKSLLRSPQGRTRRVPRSRGRRRPGGLRTTQRSRLGCGVHLAGAVRRPETLLTQGGGLRDLAQG